MILENVDNNKISFFICGDIVNRKNESGLICSNEISEIIASADYSVCNFEAPIEGYGETAHKPGLHLNQKASTIQGLKKQGFDLLLLANNHMIDYGSDALEATIKLAKENNLSTMGAGLDVNEAYEPLVIKIKGIKIGMLNACEAQYGEFSIGKESNKAGYAWINHTIIDKNIIELKEKCDYVIVFAHAGLEHYLIPQKEWRERYQYFCDLGADFVIGGHPHVPQGIDNYKNSIIFYSLGNFYFDSAKMEKKSFAIKINLSKEKLFDYEIIHHYEKDKKVYLASKDEIFDIKYLNQLLEPTNYLKEHNKMVIREFNRIKRGLAVSVFLPVPLSGSFKDFFRMFASVLLKKNKVKYKDLQQLHLLKNETYYYLIKNGLELISEKQYV